MTNNRPNAERDPDRTVQVVVSGSFRRAPELLAEEYTALREANCQILSPANVEIVDERDGFTFMEGEEDLSPMEIETRHLRAIQRAEFVWFHAPEGYVGLSGAFELGFARANGVPVYSNTTVDDETLPYFINKVNDPTEARSAALEDPVRIPPALRSMQEYYERVTKERGHHEEDAFDIMELLKEEVSELEEALQANCNTSGGGEAGDWVREELADVFLYIVHMANTLKIDLPETIRQKEKINQKRFSSHHDEK